MDTDKVIKCILTGILSAAISIGTAYIVQNTVRPLVIKPPKK